jgi:hypothetical protein
MPSSYANADGVIDLMIIPETTSNTLYIRITGTTDV